MGRGKGESKGGGRGYGGRQGKGNLEPLPRPGFDNDERLQTLEDDPRYFAGAELGKAQKAAMGISGLTGRNTASFDPKSTLVRPAMRMYYGAPGKRYKKEINLDDVIVVPNFLCEETSFDAYEHVAKELTALQATSQQDMSEAEYLQGVIAKMCKYFKIEEDGRAVRVTWYRGDSDEITLESGRFRDRMSRGHNCMVVLALGDERELAFKRTKTEELLFFPQSNGALSFFGRDVCLRWQHGMNMSPQGGTRRGHISISILGAAANAVAEKTLPLGPSDESRGEDPFDGRGGVPCREILRPSMRVVTTPASSRYTKPVKHDDVIVVPEFFCAEDDWDIYYQLLKEMRESQAAGTRNADWLSWHEGAHLLSKNPEGSKLYHKVLDKCAKFFAVTEGNRGTRFNWYRDGSDWKPFHHDSAAFNPQRAKTQDCTIGISFGASRDLALRHAKTGELVYFPQKNGMLFYFGRDTNIIWQHGINALPEEQQDGKGRISVILWGKCTMTVEEPGSPPMLDDSSRDNKGKGKGKPNFNMHGADGKGKGKQPCRDHQRGSCSYGDRCRFSHAT